MKIKKLQEQNEAYSVKFRVTMIRFLAPQLYSTFRDSKWFYICVRSVAPVTHQLIKLQYGHSQAVAATFVLA